MANIVAIILSIMLIGAIGLVGLDAIFEPMPQDSPIESALKMGK